jgi:hypothetical protein
MIRLAQKVGAAPDKLRGSEGERISNQRPIAEKAASDFSEDIRRFVRSYATVIPRHGFVELLESCIAVGMTTILTSVIEMLCEWKESGQLRKKCDQSPAQLFVDCSNGIDRALRSVAEQSFDDLMRRIESFPVILMALRLLDHSARYDPKLKPLAIPTPGTPIPTRPYATAWINTLGELLFDRRQESRAILYELERRSEQLAEKLEEDYPECAYMLRNTQSQPNPVWRLAESLTSLQGRANTQENLIKLFDSSLLLGRPNGLALKRAVTRKAIVGTRKRNDVRSLVLTDSVLDYLVHLRVLPSGSGKAYRALSFKEFIDDLRNRYGFCIDMSPPGMTISNELLRANRAILERRLRDLGLLVGVNDAEAMKRLHPRFELAAEDEYAVD